MRICNDRPQSTWTLVARRLIAFHVQLRRCISLTQPFLCDRQIWQRGGRDTSDWVDRLGQNQLSSGLSNSDTVSALLCNWAEPQYTEHGIIKNWKWFRFWNKIAEASLSPLESILTLKCRGAFPTRLRHVSRGDASENTLIKWETWPVRRVMQIKFL